MPSATKPHLQPSPPLSPQGRRGRGLAILLGLGLLGAYYFASDPAGGGLFPRCLFLQATGYRCPGCGLQRALHALLHGEVAEAFAYNYYLLVILPVALLVGATFILPRRMGWLDQLLRKPLLLATLALLTLLWWVGRNVLGY